MLILGMTLLTTNAAGAEAENSAEIKELSDKIFLNEVVRYLYRWYLNEAEVEKITATEDMTFEIRKLNPKLDDNDKSIFAEIRIPLWDIALKLKKADYVIEEINKTVKSSGFKVVNVEKTGNDTYDKTGVTTISVSIKEVREYLFKTRFQSDFPDGALFNRAKEALRREFDMEKMKKAQNEAGIDENIIYFAPISPVSNEIWIYWETQKLMLKFSSDIDIKNPLVWENEKLFVHTYDLLTQTVVSLTETNGSNRYMTRNQIGRVLFNCMVFGQRVAIKRNAK